MGEPLGESQGSTLRKSSHLASPPTLHWLGWRDRKEGVPSQSGPMYGALSWLADLNDFLYLLSSPLLPPYCQLWPFNKISLILVPSLWGLEIEICGSPQTQ